MALNRAAVRRDLPYLRRRVRPAAAGGAGGADARGADAGDADAGGADARTSGGLDLLPGASAAPMGSGLDLRPGASAAPAGSGGLSLRPAAGQASGAGGAPAGSGPGGASAAPRSSSSTAATRSATTTRPARPLLPQPFDAPAIDEVRELGPEHPVLRLDARRSAIGSLIVSGAYAIAWESTDLVTGALTLTSGGVETVGTPVTTSGNRALVGFDDGDAIVALRHLRSLRRALFLGNGSEPLGVQLFDGSQVTVAVGVPRASSDDRDAHPSGNASAGSPIDDRMFVLTLLRIGAFIELRAEPIARTLSPADLHRAFGYQMTAQFDQRQARTR